MYKILANTIFLGKDVLFLPECHSTNDKAMELIRAKQVREGSVVICSHQTQGKGQRGNQWESAPGENLTFSLILEPRFLDISEQFFLNMMVSNSLRKLLQEYLPELKVKWPNDLVIAGRGKIGGILIENILTAGVWEYAVVGIGINVNQQTFSHPKATSLRRETGGLFELQELFRMLVTYLERGYLALKKGKKDEVLKEYLDCLYLLDQWAVFKDAEGEFEAKITGISKEGKLLLENKDCQIRQVDLKEITFPDF